MIKAGVGYYLSENGEQAAKEAAVQAIENGDITKADFAVVFCTFPHRGSYKDMLKSVCQITGTTNVAGCSGIGVLTNYGEVEAKPGIAVLAVSSDEMQTTSFLVPHTTDGGIKAGVKIGEHLGPPVKGENELLTLLPDPFHIHPELLLRGIESRIGEVPIVGASASEHPAFHETYEFYGESVVSGAVSGFMIQGSFTHRIGITQGCQPVGVPCIITKSEQNLIFELDGQPAFEVLKKQVPKRILENPRDLLRLLFVGFSPDPKETEIISGEYLVRNLIGINPDTGVIGVAENVREGQIMTFTVRNPIMAREDLKQMLERLASSRDSQKPFKFGFYFNCCARGSSLYGYEGIDTAYITHTLGEIPIIGFFGNSELAPLKGINRLFTYTGVLVLISE
ncbi:MAG: FIST signal transduction protein [Thermodesulfobacteriota bacterium]